MGVPFDGMASPTLAVADTTRRCEAAMKRIAPMSTTLRSVLIAIIALSALAFFPAAGNAASKTRIGVIGAGSHGGTIGQLWVKAGHEVMFSSRTPSELESMVKQLGPLASAGTPQQAAEFGSVVFFAVPRPVLGESPTIDQSLMRSSALGDQRRLTATVLLPSTQVASKH